MRDEERRISAASEKGNLTMERGGAYHGPYLSPLDDPDLCAALNRAYARYQYPPATRKRPKPGWRKLARNHSPAHRSKFVRETRQALQALVETGRAVEEAQRRHNSDPTEVERIARNFAALVRASEQTRASE